MLDSKDMENNALRWAYSYLTDKLGFTKRQIVGFIKEASYEDKRCSIQIVVKKHRRYDSCFVCWCDEENSFPDIPYNTSRIIPLSEALNR